MTDTTPSASGQSGSPPRSAIVTAADVMLDLEAGRSAPLRPGGPQVALGSVRRPALAGPAFMATYLAARLLGGLSPRLAGRLLLRLWLTPWVHPAALRPVDQVSSKLATWSLPAANRTLRGFTGGTGPTVVLVHGWAGRAADWRHLADALIDAGWRVVAPDLPAHGMTPGRTTDLFELGGALATVLDHERPAALVTHSLGFPIALRALDTGAEVPPMWVALAPGRKMSHALTRFGAKAQLRPALITQLRRAIERHFGNDIWDVLDADRVTPDLTADGVVIHDDEDDEVAVDDGRHIAQIWPRARFVTTRGLGHRRILRDERVHGLIADALHRQPVTSRTLRDLRPEPTV